MLEAGNCFIATSFSSPVNVIDDLRSEAASTFMPPHLHTRRKGVFAVSAHPQHNTVQPAWRDRSRLHLQRGLFTDFAHTTRLPSILLSNPSLSAPKGGPVRNAGKATPPPGSHVAHHLFSLIFYFFWFLFVL